MSLKATIQRAVDQVFSAVGDLVETVTLSKAVDMEYDWEAGAYTGTTSSLTVEVIFTEANADGANDTVSSPNYTAVIRTGDIGLSLDFYTKLTRGGVDYTIASIEQYEGVTLLKLQR